MARTWPQPSWVRQWRKVWMSMLQALRMRLREVREGVRRSPRASRRWYVRVREADRPLLGGHLLRGFGVHARVADDLAVWREVFLDPQLRLVEAFIAVLDGAVEKHAFEVPHRSALPFFLLCSLIGTNGETHLLPQQAET